MRLKNYHKRVEATSEPSKILVKHSMDILDRIDFLFDKYYGRNYLILCGATGYEKEYFENLFNGVQDYSLRQISELESIFGEPIINVVKPQQP